MPRRGRPPSANSTGVIRTCRKHGLIVHHRIIAPRSAAGYVYRCKRCVGEAVWRRKQRIKEILVAENGGCCQACGYDGCMSVLVFHHLDPSTKSFEMSTGTGRSLRAFREEAKKCVLLCANCHSETESGVFPSPAASIIVPSRAATRSTTPRIKKASQIRPPALRECRRHGLTYFRLYSDKHGRHRWHCVACGSEAVTRRRQKLKRLLADEAGGRCVACGYDRSLAALHFHHVDPESKKLSMHLQQGRSVSAYRDEAKKCVLVCANCHGEIEAGLIPCPPAARDRATVPRSRARSRNGSSN
jgi:hypothetical protein